MFNETVFLSWVMSMFGEIVRVVFPAACATFLIGYGIRLSWNLIKGRGLK